MLSVVIPAYNAAGTIGRTLRSILAQTLLPSEIIVVDDGSTDGTASAALEAANPLLRVVRQSNQGVSAARNRGIAEATAGIVAFCDADDEWRPQFLATIARLASAYPEAAVYATRYRIVPPDAPAYDARINRLPSDFEGILPDYFTLASRSDPVICSSAVAVRKNAFESIGGFPVGIVSGEDLLTWARLAARYPIAYSFEVLLNVNCPARLDFSRTMPAGDPVGRALTRLLDEVPPAMRPGLRRYLARWHDMRVCIALGQKNPRAARYHFYRALCYSPLNPRMFALGVLSALPTPLSYRLFTLARTVSHA